ncbi:MAG: NAD(P)/FAD-dependent oxidoreductase [Candidatus Staskawiczbacteria bacterium]|nr:NAD(P)/FAD-dependent oxidoreductase [Candidatus Staskawiczbacteria bacterium]
MPKEDTKEQSFDVAVIGGGPAGMMSALIAAENGSKVILLEKNKQLGKKLLLTGGGRCNITNAEFNLRKLVENYSKGGEFLFHAFSVFGPEKTINFFNKLGIETKIEKNNRVFPVDNDAREVLEVFEKHLKKNKVEVLFNSEVKDIVCAKNNIKKIVLQNGEVTAKKYIICTGGKSYSLTGSDGAIYKLVEKLGHTIVPPTPALVPISLKDEWAKKMQGISLNNLKIIVIQNNKKQFSEQGEILFTHFGITGPAILNISGKVGDLLGKGEVTIVFDLFPDLNYQEVLKELEDILVRYPNRTVKNILSFLVPEGLAEVLCDMAQVKREKIANNMSKIERASVAKTLKNIEATVSGLLGWDLAHVTMGGVSLKEIDHKTMKSKIIGNLYFAGEIIDIDGKSGGFNLQSCWSTGYLAGKSATIF